MLKKILIAAGVILLLIVLGIGLLMYRVMGMADSIEKESAKLTRVNLSRVADGTYSGSYGNFIVSAKVEVMVKSHRIKKIIIVDQKCGRGYEARDTIRRIMDAQSSKVDAVSGASSTSRTLMLAVDRALKQGIK
jgi:uncharacterized protein with FMN-binding domain